MKKIFTSVLVAVMAATMVAALFGNFDYSTASAQTNKVQYTAVPAGTYDLDVAHGLIGFSVRHFEINWVKGRFKDFKGRINYDASDVTKSSVEFSAKIESIDTAVAARDTHLKSADFFDAAKFPEMKFVSTKVAKNGKKGFIVTGDLTIKGVTKQVSFPFTMTGAVKDPWGGTRFGVEAQTKINRRDYGINYGGPFLGGVDIGNAVDIDLQLEAVKAKE